MTKMADTFDELASMFLSTPTQTGGDAAAGPIVELLLTGHLPVRGNLWLIPYAERLASNAGPVTIIRLDGEEPALQLIGHATDDLLDAAGETWLDAVDRLGRKTSAWVVRLPGGSEPAAWMDSGVDRLTVMTSGDQAAVASAYQVLKRASDAAPEGHDQWPDVGLAVVGVDEDRARDVAHNIRRTAQECLGLDVELVMTLPRMDVSTMSSRHLHFPHDPMPDLVEALAAVDRAMALFAETASDHDEMPSMRLVSDASRVALPAPESDASIPSFRPEHADFDIPRFPRHGARPVLRVDDTPSPVPAIEDVIEEALHDVIGDTAQTEDDMVPPSTAHAPMPSMPEPIVEPAVEMASSPAASASPKWPVDRPRTPGHRLAPKPVAEVEGKSPAQMREPVGDHGLPRPLASHVEGLTPLAMRPPRYEQIELAVDAAGCLHLLGHEVDLRAMRRVEQWASDHREILAMAAGGIAIDVRPHRVTSHVFTSEPARLADLHEAGVRLHVLAPVDMDGRRGWFAAPLNRPS
ncbi:MAG: hypothetical protein AAF432_05745 [Planctomycetota bacterium]